MGENKNATRGCIMKEKEEIKKLIDEIENKEMLVFLLEFIKSAIKLSLWKKRRLISPLYFYLTVTLHFALIPDAIITVMVAFPFFFAVILPLEFTAATFLLLDLYLST